MTNPNPNSAEITLRNNHGIFYINMNNSGFGDFNLNTITNNGGNNIATVAGFGMAFLNNNSMPHTIRNNTITSMPNANFNSNGFSSWNIWCCIHAQSSGNLRYCSNTLQGGFQALHKLNANAVNDAVINNNVLSNWRGFSQEMTGEFGFQLCRHNNFIPPANGVNSYFDAGFNATNCGGTFGFSIDVNDPIQNPLPRTCFPWFSDAQNCHNLLPPACPVAIPGGIVPPNPDGPGQREQDIAVNQFYPSTDLDYTSWDGRYKLYSAIKRFPSTYGNAIYSQFVSNYQNTGIGKLDAVETLIHSAMIYTPAQEFNRIKWSKEIDSLLTITKVIDDVINSSITINWVLIAEKGRKLSSLDSLRLLRKDVKASLFVKTNVELNQAINILNTWVPQQDYESNEIVTKKYYLKQVLNNLPLSISAADSLLTIALLCPFTGGNAVYQARTLLQSNGYDYVYDNPDHDCSNQLRSHKVLIEQPEPKVKLVPNPNFGTVKLLSDIPINNATILDMHGRVVLSISSDGAFSELDTSSLPNGLYIITLSDINGNKSTLKMLKQ